MIEAAKVCGRDFPHRPFELLERRQALWYVRCLRCRWVGWIHVGARVLGMEILEVAS